MAILKIALWEIKSMKKEKTMLVVIVFFLFVSSFSSVLTFGFASIYSPAEDTKIGLIGNASVFESVVKPESYVTFDAALHDFHSGKLDIIVLLEENPSSQNIMSIFLPAEEVRAIKVSTALKEKLIQYQNRLRAQLIFSLSSATLIILSFSFPLSFMNLLSRVSANSCFYGTEILAYFLGSVCSLCILVFVSIKGLGWVG